ncbi:MAG: histidine kinase [Saprospiraceae bacterium]|nr:histidine kinase [Saprospiraceae bacterium]
MQRKSRTIIVLVIWLIAFVTLVQVQAQVAYYREIPLSAEYKVNAMAQDAFGFLWLGTSQGIVIYNGYDEIIIPSLQNMDITTLKSQGNKIYVGTAAGSIYIIDGSNHQLISKVSPFTRSKISDIEFLDNHQWWASSYGDGVYIFNNDSLLHKCNSLKSKDIYALQSDGKGRMFVASDQGITVVRPDKGKTFKTEEISGLPDYIIVSLCLSKNGSIIAATYDKEIIEIADNKKITTLFKNTTRSRNHNIYCADQSLIFHSGNELYEWRGNTLQTIQLPQSRENISYVFVDKENQIWISDNKASLLRTSNHFVHYTLSGLSDIQCSAFDGSNFYLGTSAGVFASPDPTGKKGRWILKNENITVIRVIHKKIWIGTFSNGLYLYDLESKALSHVGRLFDTHDNTILDIEKTNDTSVEVSTLAGVIHQRIDINGGLSQKQNNNDHVLKAYVYDIYADAYGGVWYGKDRNGLTLVRSVKTTEWKEIINRKDNKPYKLGSVFSLMEGLPGEIYMASSNLGLVRYKDGLWDLVPHSFFVKNQIVGLSKYDENHLLVIRNNSIDVLELSTLHLLPFPFNKQGEAGISYLNNFITSGKDCYFAIANALVRFSPGGALSKKHPVTRLDKVEVNLETILSHQHSFRQHENNLRFSFTAGWLGNPGAVQYAYKLEGFDVDWRYTGDRVVSYPHLSPNKYVFKVKATENQAFFDEPITTYEFEIHRAFYNTWWFYLAIVLMIILALQAFVRRRKNVELLKSELSRIKTEAELINLKSQLDPHFLFNTLNTLIGLIEEDPKRGVRFTENLTQFFRRLSQSSQKELIALSEELHLVETYIVILKERFGNNISVVIEPLAHQEAESYLVPPVSVQMLIENAVKHNEVSRSKPLTVKIRWEKEFLIISNEKQPKNGGVASLGIGNNNIYERYRLMGLPKPYIVENNTEYHFYLPLIKKHGL